MERINTSERTYCMTYDVYIRHTRVDVKMTLELFFVFKIKLKKFKMFSFGAT